MRLVLVAWFVLIMAMADRSVADTYKVTLDPAARSEPATGRLILFFITQSGGHGAHVEPMEGPFFEGPQPIASIAVKDLKPGEPASIDGSVFAFPFSLNDLSGDVRVQAVLDIDQTERSHEQGPGNLYSDEVKVKVDASREDSVELRLTHVIPAPAAMPERSLVKWFTLRSELLSKHYGRDVYHRAGAAFPRAYLDPKSPRQQWPAIYIIPGYGDRHEGALEYSQMFETEGTDELAPVAVHIVLDPESPLGHHGFVDSPANGPRGMALVTEFIPYLESQLRIIARPEARILTGHSSGGWTSLWLQLHFPNVFGACWSSAPDPIDFSAFQMTDLYHDPNLYTGSDGQPTPSFRRYGPPLGDMRVAMTTREEGMMEYAIDPAGGSGQQWDAWEAMFSPLDPATGLPRPMFDGRTGAIDAATVENWKKFDINRLVAENWEKLGPIVLQRIRLVVGDEDSFYLNRAVERFRDNVRRMAGESPWSPGYIEIIKDADHGRVIGKTFMRWNQEMRTYLKEHGLQD